MLRVKRKYPKDLLHCKQKYIYQFIFSYSYIYDNYSFQSICVAFIPQTKSWSPTKLL